MVRDEPTIEGPPNMSDLVIEGTPTDASNTVITEIARAVPPTVVKPAVPQKLRVSSGVAQGCWRIR
jgi:hypothetical protein